jgi:hypothetical protein
MWQIIFIIDVEQILNYEYGGSVQKRALKLFGRTPQHILLRAVNVPIRRTETFRSNTATYFLSYARNILLKAYYYI